MTKALVKFKKLEGYDTVTLPSYAKEGDSGMDVRSAIKETVPAGQVRLIQTGLQMAYIEPGFEIQVRSRSGLAAKNCIFVLNSPGTIDNGYKGPVGVILANFGTIDFNIEIGDRIAQLVLCPVMNSTMVSVEEETETVKTTERGSGGFGSSGVK